MKNHLLTALVLAPDLVLVLATAALSVDPFNFGPPVFLTYTRDEYSCSVHASSRGYDSSVWYQVPDKKYGECYGRKIAGVKG